LAALELGETTIKEIAKKAELKRTTIYDFIDEMVNRGYFKLTAKGKKKKYLAASPEELKVIVQKREALLLQIMPMLNSMSSVSGTKPKIRFYEGIDGLKEVYLDSLKYSGEILAIGGEETIQNLGHDWILSYIQKRIKKGIPVRAIAAKSDFVEREYTSKDQEQFRSSKVVDSKKYSFPIEINIYGHQRIFFVSTRDQMGIIIESSEIHQAMKSFFELLWDNLPEIKIK